jgi:hypothetical protein
MHDVLKRKKERKQKGNKLNNRKNTGKKLICCDARFSLMCASAKPSARKKRSIRKKNNKKKKPESIREIENLTEE